MKNIKKVTVIVLAALVLLAGGIIFGSTVGANSNWQSDLNLAAQREIDASGHELVQEFKQQGLTEQMKTAIDPKIAEEQAELERLLNEYYRMKIEGLTETPEFAELEAKVEELRRLAYKRFTGEIDAMFTGK